MNTAKSKKRKVLIVSFYFPPANTIAAVRVGKLAKYLPEFGWEPIVLTAKEINWLPQTLPQEIDEANVIRVRGTSLACIIREKLGGKDPFTPQTPTDRQTRISWRQGLLSALRVMRPIYTLPLLRILVLEPLLWYHNAVETGLQMLADHRVDLIFSSTPPPTPHLVASRLHCETGIPWVGEYRDLWTQNPCLSKVQPLQFLEEQWEKKTMRHCSRLITVSEPNALTLERLHGKRVEVIHNGFDEEDYTEDVPLTQKFTITYTGTIYRGRQDPGPLFRAVAELRQEGKISPDDLEVRFFGSNPLDTIAPLIEEYGLQQFVKIGDYVPFKESIRRQKESTVLLLLGWNDPREKGVYTGKVFEYLGAGRPILDVGPKGDVVDALLARTGSGVASNEAGEIKAILLQWLAEFRQQGRISSYFNPKPEIIKGYTRREQTRKLAKVFDEVVAEHR